MCLALILKSIQHLAYGYSGHESFLDGVSNASPARRVLAMIICGLFAGFGWLLVYAKGKPLMSIKQAVGKNGAPMPVWSTLGHALLQIITVALGSPLGREVAPREIGALWAGWIARAAGLSPEHCKLLVACGAGAGLAAVYNVPLGGAVFVLEVLLVSFGSVAIIMAFSTAGIASLVAWSGLGNDSQYHISDLPLSPGLIAWSVIFGPIFGIAAQFYVDATTKARAKAPRTTWSLPLMSVCNFAVIGLFAIVFPQLLGNGKGPAQLGFDSNLGFQLAAILLILKTVFTISSLRAGAEGGLLTPGITIGALLATLLAYGWSCLMPGISVGACAIVGGTAFLASSMSMPLTAIVLMMEFTRFNHDILFPVVLAVSGSVLANKVCAYYRAQ
jgi:H+/Cl- antiporter ClcA